MYFCGFLQFNLFPLGDDTVLPHAKKNTLQGISGWYLSNFQQNSSRQQHQLGWAAGEKIYIRESRKKKLPHKTLIMKTILVTDVFSALDFAHTVNKDQHTSKYMNNTIQKRRLGGGGVHNTDRNISENPREKKGYTLVWFLAVARKDKFIYGYKALVHSKENDLVPYRQVKCTPLRKELLNWKLFNKI